MYPYVWGAVRESGTILFRATGKMATAWFHLCLEMLPSSSLPSQESDLLKR